MKNVEDIYPLAPSQHGILFHTLSAPETGAYFVQVVFAIQGALRVEALRRAFDAAVQRHGVLRTAFFWDKLDQPLQVVRQSVRMPWTFEDLAALPAHERSGRITDHLDRDRARGFDPTRAPLTRAALFREGAEAYRLVWSFHHLVLDGWSWPLVWSDVRRSYAGADDEPPPARSFRDYVAWIQRQDADASRAFWRARAKDIRETPLPLEEPSSTSARGTTTLEFALSDQDCSRLKAFAREHDLTVSTLVQAAWGLLLLESSGAAAATFGAVTAGRPADLPDVETMPGMFVNVLPCTVTLVPDATVHDWLRGIQTASAEQRAHEWLSLADVHDAIGAPGPFRSVVTIQNYPIHAGTFSLGDDARVTDIRSVEWNHYPLTLAIRVDPPVQGRFRYDAGRFAPGAIGEIVARFRRALSAFVRGDAGRVGDLVRAPAAAAASRPAACPQPAAREPAQEAPRTELESALARIFTDVLAAPSIGVHDDFFAAGGHSLRAMQVVARVRRTLGIDLPLRALFDAPTIAGLSAFIEGARTAGAPTS